MAKRDYDAGREAAGKENPKPSLVRCLASLRPNKTIDDFSRGVRDGQRYERNGRR